MAERLNCVLSNIYISTYNVVHNVTLNAIHYNAIHCNVVVFVCTPRYDCVSVYVFPKTPNHEMKPAKWRSLEQFLNGMKIDV